MRNENAAARRPGKTDVEEDTRLDVITNHRRSTSRREGEDAGWRCLREAEGLDDVEGTFDVEDAKELERQE